MGQQFRSAALAAIGLALTAITPSQAQAPASVRPPDGTWQVSGRAIPGTRCGDWYVRIINRQGRLSGIVGLSQGNVPIYGLALQPDGSFSGVTRAGHVNARAVRANEINGQFNGLQLSLTLENEICPTRAGSAMRGGY
jgi:hypothetical protein